MESADTRSPKVNSVRIVSLLPSATEILYAIGAGDDLVGVTHECDFPSQATSLPILTSSALPSESDAATIDRHVRSGIHQGSSIYHLDASLLERLAPDLIVTQELCDVCAVSYERVSSAALKMRGDSRILALEPSSFEEVLDTIGTLGTSCGREIEAARVVAQLSEHAERLRERARRELPDPPRLLFLEWSDPPFPPGHWTPDLLALLGLRSSIEFPHAPARAVTWEAILESDPDIVAVAPCGFDLPKARRAIADLDRHPAWRQLRAVRAGRVIALDGNAYFNRPGVRLVEGAERLLDALVGLAS
ncbi:MAG: ABC transporter substrate-binding protein [Candidatus Baltobacteraceae bacterium]